MKVKNEIKICEIDGVDTKVGETTVLEVESVWNRRKCIALTVSGGKRIVVMASHLQKAIINATDNED